MPDLDKSAIDELTAILKRYLAKRSGFGEPTFVASGGSAAVFSVSGQHGVRAFKVMSPTFLADDGSFAEKRRLALQRKLIGHECPQIIGIYNVDEFETTAVLEMDFLAWEPLGRVLDQVPDSAIPGLFTQLVSAARYLESLDIVHRDIKPENILVSSDFKELKLLDLGVARLLEDEEASTDQDNRRPFVATAQYSSPEYLFRLDTPTPRLWKGLNIYQLGGVLYALIRKEDLFAEEVRVGNRFVVARAVLEKVPSFPPDHSHRLDALKALAYKCLTKDLDTRLRLVDWSDLSRQASVDPLVVLQKRIEKSEAGSLACAQLAHQNRLEFDRERFLKRFIEGVQRELRPVCGTKLPFAVELSLVDQGARYGLRLNLDNQLDLLCQIKVDWKFQPYERSAEIRVRTHFIPAEAKPRTGEGGVLVCIGDLDAGEDQAVNTVCRSIAKCLTAALDLVELATSPGQLYHTEVPIPTNDGTAEEL